MKNTYCSKCGSKEEGNEFCSKCGNKLSVEDNVIPELKDKEKTKKTSESPSKKNKIFYIILIFSFAIIYGFLSIYDDGYYLGKKTYIDYIKNSFEDAGVSPGGLGNCSLIYLEYSINNNKQGIYKIDIDELSKGIDNIPTDKYGLVDGKDYHYIKSAFLLRIKYYKDRGEYEMALKDYDSLIKATRETTSGSFGNDYARATCNAIFLMDKILLQYKLSEQNNLKINEERICNDFVNSFSYEDQFKDEKGDIISRFILQGKSSMRWFVWSRKYQTDVLFEKLMKNCNLIIKEMDSGGLLMRNKMYYEEDEWIKKETLEKKKFDNMKTELKAIEELLEKIEN